MFELQISNIFLYFLIIKKIDYFYNKAVDLELILSIIGHIFITISGTIGAYFWLKGQGFYEDVVKGSELETGN